MRPFAYILAALILGACATSSRPTVWQAFPDMGARVGVEVSETQETYGVMYESAVVVERDGATSRLGADHESRERVPRYSIYETPNERFAVVIDYIPYVPEGTGWRVATSADRVAEWRYLGAFDVDATNAVRFYSLAEQSECTDPHDTPDGIVEELTDRPGNNCDRK